MNITKEKLNEISDEAKLLNVVGECVGVKLNDKYGIFIEVINYGDGKEYLIELNRIDNNNGWNPCAKYNAFSQFKNKMRLIETIMNYVEAFDEEETL